MLDMKRACERCTSLLGEDDDAYICCCECTFCATCTRWFQNLCPNCMSELARRPRRRAGAERPVI
jgi:hypothetical protein